MALWPNRGLGSGTLFVVTRQALGVTGPLLRIGPQAGDSRSVPWEMPDSCGPSRAQGGVGPAGDLPCGGRCQYPPRSPSLRVTPPPGAVRVMAISSPCSFLETGPRPNSSLGGPAALPAGRAATAKDELKWGTGGRGAIRSPSQGGVAPGAWHVPTGTCILEVNSQAESSTPEVPVPQLLLLPISGQAISNLHGAEEPLFFGWVPLAGASSCVSGCFFPACSNQLAPGAQTSPATACGQLTRPTYRNP